MLTDEDYFTTKDKKAWKTIFTNEMACLRLLILLFFYYLNLFFLIASCLDTC